MQKQERDEQTQDQVDAFENRGIGGGEKFDYQSDRKVESGRLHVQVEQTFRQPGAHENRIDELPVEGHGSGIEADSGQIIQNPGNHEGSQHHNIRGLREAPWVGGRAHEFRATSTIW